jgi:putative glycosyltransferase (TIGR04372 family)
MFQRKLKIVVIALPTPLRILSQLAANNSILKTLDLFTEPKYRVNDFYEFNNCPPMLNFTNDEKKKGKEILKQMNINNWFVCVNVRDKKYLDTVLKKRDESDDYRNGNIQNTTLALEYIIKREGYVLRMGAKVENRLDIENKKIIDYASNWRTEFGDIYLSAHCKFFLGDTSGLICIPYIFNRPLALINVIPLNHPPINKQSLFIPKKIWFKKEQRYLTFKEIIEFEKEKYFIETKDYTSKEYIPHENTPQEILDLTVEMNERLNGTWKSTAEDETLQQKYKSIFPPTSHCYGFPSRIGTVFLRENKDLLN